MKCLVVVAHPLNTSLCHSLAGRVTDGLLQAGHDVVVSDLYAEGFNPTLTPAERTSYHAPVYDRTALGDRIHQLEEAEALFLVFPTWWFGFPAILKGWFDRVWAPGAAFDHAADFGPISPRLNTLKQVVAITTLGSPWWVDWLVLRRPVKRQLKLALLGACARGAKLEFLSLYKAEAPGEAQLARFRKRIDKALSRAF